MSQPRAASSPAPPPALASASGGAAVSGGITAGQMSLVLDVSRMLAVTADLDVLLRSMAQAVTALLNCERASIFLHDAANDQLWTKVALGLEGQKEIRIATSVGIVGHVFRTSQPLHVARPYEDPRFNSEPDKRTGFRTRNILAAPMLDINQAPVGVVQAINKTDSGAGAGSGAEFSDNDVAMLQLLADQAGVAIQRYKLQQDAIQSLNLRHEMELARSVQEAMIPRVMPEVAGLAAAGYTVPASINGGDVFDLWKTPDGRLGVLLADASGHGIAPAMVACQVRTLVRALSEAGGAGADPTRLLTVVNRRLHEDLPSGRFVTCFLGFLAPDGDLAWCSAGHGPVLTCDGASGRADSLDATLPPLGVIDDLPEEAGPPARLSRGQALVVASDGITEAFNPSGEMFGDARLIETLSPTVCGPPDATIATLRSAVRRWHGKDEPHDDQTAVVVVRR
jgi:sigma-B regulation protein RsbU (phosphoserine phosphatase)